MSNLIIQLSELFESTGHAHHAAFIDTDGVDPEWPLWYADYLIEKLPEKIGATNLTKSELIYLLVMADRHLQTYAPGAEWPQFYAKFFIDRYGE